MKKRLLIMLTLCLLLLTITGCANLVNTETIDVKVQVADSYYRDSYSTPMVIGQTTILQSHPAVYRIFVEYDGRVFCFDDYNTYCEYKDSIGETVDAKLTINTYDNGKKYNYVSHLKKVTVL